MEFLQAGKQPNQPFGWPRPPENAPLPIAGVTDFEIQYLLLDKFFYVY